VTSERDRESLIKERAYDLERAERREKEERRKEGADKLRAALESKPWLNASTAWRKVKAEFADEAVFSSLPKEEALRAFEGVIMQLERDASTAQAAVRKAERCQERIARDAFRALLAEQQDKGAIHALSRWEDCKKTLAQDPRYYECDGRQGSLACELFGGRWHFLVAFMY
jgi:pre-mRNA-processing factor 40